MGNNNQYSVDTQTLNLIAAQEGFSSGAYKDAGGYSIGFGHYIKEGEKDKYMGREISKAEALDLLKEDIIAHQKPWIGDLQKDLNPTQLAAITSFAYNTGAGSAKKVVDFINKGDMKGATAYMNQFVNARSGPGGPKVVMEALQKRRSYETEMLLSTDGRSADDIMKSKISTWDSVKNFFSGKKVDTMASMDMNGLGQNNDEILQRLRALNASLGARAGEGSSERAWATRVLAEGRGWAAP